MRELKAIRLLLMGSIGKELQAECRKELLLHLENHAVVHVTNPFVSASRGMMRELRRHKLVLDHHGMQIRSEWIPSAANRFTDALSRRFPPRELTAPAPAAAFRARCYVSRIGNLDK